jgi:hypothetical protein
VELSRNNVIRRNKEVFLGFVVLTPSKAGLLEHKVVFQLTGQKTNRTYKVELPIIGTVSTGPLLAGKGPDGNEPPNMVINQI